MVQQIPQMMSGMLGGLFGGHERFDATVNPAPAAGDASHAGRHGCNAAWRGRSRGSWCPTCLVGGGHERRRAWRRGAVSVAESGATPTAMLGPLPAPTAGTEPAAAHGASGGAPSSGAPTSAPRGGMGGMPMMPPGAMHGAGGAGKDEKPDTKRIVAPTVKNGAPVQGRITTPPPSPEVVKRLEGKPIASRRILLPDQKRDENDPDSNRQ